MKAALINKSSGNIENIIELPDDYDPKVKGTYSPGEHLFVEKDIDGKARIGGSFRNGQWETPEDIPTELAEATVEEKFDALTELLLSKGTITDAEAAEVKASKETKV